MLGNNASLDTASQPYCGVPEEVRGSGSERGGAGSSWSTSCDLTRAAPSLLVESTQSGFSRETEPRTYHCMCIRDHHKELAHAIMEVEKPPRCAVCK